MPTPRLREVCIWKTNLGGTGRGAAACAALQIADVHDDCLVFYATWTPSACLDVCLPPKHEAAEPNLDSAAFPAPLHLPIVRCRTRPRTCLATGTATKQKRGASLWG
jgi:hypothetical protein